MTLRYPTSTAWERLRSLESVDYERLARRQRQVVKACRAGLSVREAAIALSIEEQTVRVLARSAEHRIAWGLGHGGRGGMVKPLVGVDLVPCTTCGLRGHLAATCDITIEAFAGWRGDGAQMEAGG